MKWLLLPVALIFIPVLLGLPWKGLLPERRLLRMLACWPLGYFLMLSVFEMLTVPFIWLRGSFFLLAPVYTGILAVTGGLSLFTVLRARKKQVLIGNGGAKHPDRGRMHPLTYWEWLYLIAFLVLVVFQTVRAVTWDVTIMNYDDSDYLVRAADALNHGLLLGVRPSTGLAEPISLKRMMQGSLFFPAWLSWLSDLPLTVVARTILEVTHLLMAYMVLACMAVVLFPERENGLIFLLLLSLLFMMGFYSHYSPTFRLLGPNYQGKAVLAVVFSPFVFTLMMIKIQETYDRRFVLLLPLLSLAAVSLTLFGTAVMIADVSLPVILSMIRRPRQWKKLIYILCASVFPAVCGAAYLFLH